MSADRPAPEAPPRDGQSGGQSGGQSAAPSAARIGATRAGRWGDLGVRLASGLVLAGVGGLAVLVGGGVFLGMTVLVFAVMGWELAAMSDEPPNPATRLSIAVLAGAGLFVAEWDLAWDEVVVAALLMTPLALAATPRRDRVLLALYALAMMVAAHGFVALDRRGVVIVVWLVSLVVASDVFGYFAGRLIGGRRFWPAISPKKTWAGTLAGWGAAAVLGLGFAIWAGGGWSLVLISPLVAFAGQMGDIAESLIKRRAGVKDASRLIPGHGGVLDRFDALIGAILAVQLLELVMPLPLGMAT